MGVVVPHRPLPAVVKDTSSLKLRNAVIASHWGPSAGKMSRNYVLPDPRHVSSRGGQVSAAEEPSSHQPVWGQSKHLGTIRATISSQPIAGVNRLRRVVQHNI